MLALNIWLFNNQHNYLNIVVYWINLAQHYKSIFIGFKYFEKYYINKGLTEKVIKILRNLDIYNWI